MALLRRAADLISERSNELAALMTMEVGKNRMEALGDVEETADLIYYYCDQMEDNDGFARKMGQLSANEHTRSVLRPYGVWVVISPFNFPMALAGGPGRRALVAGNTVVFKPAPQGSVHRLRLSECLRDAGLPDGVFNFSPGGRRGGRAADRGTRAWTASPSPAVRVGMKIYRTFAAGRIPTLHRARWAARTRPSSRATPTSNAPPPASSARPSALQGQKCSANSRVYVEGPVQGVHAAPGRPGRASYVVGDPTDREN